MRKGHKSWAILLEQSPKRHAPFLEVRQPARVQTIMNPGSGRRGGRTEVLRTSEFIQAMLTNHLEELSVVASAIGKAGGEGE